MPILTRCTVTGCRTLTIGEVCLAHDLRPVRTFARGRPFAPETAAVRASIPSVAATSKAAVRAGVVVLLG